MRTEFGSCVISKGYYVVSSSEKGYHGQPLHRLLYCKYHNCTLEDIEGMHIHHIDNNPLNNDKENLQKLTPKEHSSLHHKGENHPFYGKHLSDETKKKISKTQTGKKQSQLTKSKISKAHNTSGYYRVTIVKNKQYKQGFIYVYRYIENNKRKTLYSVDILKLKQKVEERGLLWYEIKELE